MIERTTEDVKRFHDNMAEIAKSRRNRIKMTENERLLLNALRVLTRYATHGNHNGNPYGKPEVKQALQAIATVRGCKDWMDANA
jgi:hypothetical protein